MWPVGGIATQMLQPMGTPPSPPLLCETMDADALMHQPNRADATTFCEAQREPVQLATDLVQHDARERVWVLGGQPPAPTSVTMHTGFGKPWVGRTRSVRRALRSCAKVSSISRTRIAQRRALLLIWANRFCTNAMSFFVVATRSVTCGTQV